MTTKKQYADQCRAENPKPVYATINAVQVELTDDEYETMIENWAEMRIAQDVVQEQANAAIAAKESAKAKLAALGLTEEEVNAIIGGV